MAQLAYIRDAGRVKLRRQPSVKGLPWSTTKTNARFLAVARRYFALPSSMLTVG